MNYNQKGRWMKVYSFGLRKQDMILSMVLIFIVAGLIYQGLFSFYNASLDGGFFLLKS